MNFKEFQYPDLANFEENFTNLLQDVENNVNKLMEVEDKTYENFYLEMEYEYKRLEDFTFPLSHVNSNKNTDETSEVWSKITPVWSEWGTKMGQREDIYEAIKSLSNLTPAQERVIEREIRGFRHSGIGLEKDKQDRIKEIGKRLSELKNDFKQNVQDAQKEFKLLVTDPEEVKDIPENDLKLNEVDGGWEFTLQYPSYVAYIKDGSNREHRKALYKARVSQAPQNEEIIEEILKLKHEKALILGYNNFAEISLSSKMADTPQDVMDFHERLAGLCVDKSKIEEKELNDYAGFELMPWDRSYYSKRYTKDSFDYDVEEFRPYLEQSNVISGMFSFLNKTFDLSFKKAETTTWDEKVTVYDVYRKNNLMARIYMDLESRDDKRPGAWMNDSESYHVRNGETILPIAYISCNFTPSTEETPSLLKPGEVTTLFHEMGHVLQHICSEIEDISYSGLNGVEWDAVEWSSQFLEEFGLEDEVLKTYANHYETGELVPDELLEKRKNLKSYRSATGLVWQMELGMFDMAIHQQPMTKEEVQTTMDNIRERLGCPEPKWNKYQCNFNHIFSGGYSAGYYSYKWAEVLSADCYMEFKEKGIFNRELADKYYNTFLSQGTKVPSMEMFENFMGRKPKEESLIKMLGI